MNTVVPTRTAKPKLRNNAHPQQPCKWLLMDDDVAIDKDAFKSTEEKVAFHWPSINRRINVIPVELV